MSGKPTALYHPLVMIIALSETLEFEDFVQKLLVHKLVNNEKVIDETEKDETEESDDSDEQVSNENDEETEDESDSLGAGDGADASKFEL
ncbi:uncharacterized protein MONOS_8512 [Monocercomonoides exilis]|uniref:uncharacterized protein n=1 Tax=Monocercomonoides exilis TaxID=2049356 RepID=UPI00355A0A62|nr:hypothetical protein MONOS_8512 [Monocercomonoides exilis]|eukprot:MONOS_8512.1-p1 / transcript=MONOS_8512.1 / gene=MONOS_8512 / organism=Monocercomonoides_exilis_PA203 / gene_product=unspecified product / transcript_product=unspecified product / location=Mono_scaffold00323:4138-4559(+) / protein_length=90 / sequence_SO=supercontig / SO=protein_coding / is_pseudo=false